jgi:hypothetical protein
VVGVSENGGEDSQRSRVGEEGTHRNCGRLHRGQVYRIVRLDVDLSCVSMRLTVQGRHGGWLMYSSE